MATRQSASTRPAVLTSWNRHVVDRFSHGVSEELMADIGSRRNANTWFDQQLVPSRVRDASGDAVISWFPRLRDSPADAWKAAKSQERSAWQYGLDLSCYTIGRKVVSKRQLHEVMADFWSNLLYIPAGEDRSFPWRYDYDNAIRANALTSYRKLLRAAVVHPAMSGWLNNSSNTKKGINENLGRELLELFTVGRPAGYDEEDVKNSARLLTGYRVKVFDTFESFYDPAVHWTGSVKVLGFQHANSDADGRAAVGAYLDYLARHPATAKRIAYRLCLRFVSDTPSEKVVASIANAYLKADTDVRKTLVAVKAHREFSTSRKYKMRSPLEDVIATTRAVGMKPTGVTKDESLLRHLYWMSSDLGQAQFGWPRPDGFPETSTTWGSPARVLRSWDLHYALSGNWWKSVDVKRPTIADGLPSSFPRTLDELVEHQARVLLARSATAPMKAAVASALWSQGTRVFKTSADVSDWTWTVIRATVLNHPEGMLR